LTFCESYNLTSENNHFRSEVAEQNHTHFTRFLSENLNLDNADHPNYAGGAKANHFGNL